MDAISQITLDSNLLEDQLQEEDESIFYHENIDKSQVLEESIDTLSELKGDMLQYLEGKEALGHYSVNEFEEITFFLSFSFYCFPILIFFLSFLFFFLEMKNMNSIKHSLRWLRSF